METRILPVNAGRIGKLTARPNNDDFLDELSIDYDRSTDDTRHLELAAEQLRTSDVPVAFPTETVYGLGADATRSAAVKGIYKAKQRPSDNPLIVHFASLNQIRSLLRDPSEPDNQSNARDPIPEIYHPLIRRFWPGPMTIILPNPRHSRLAPEVTAGLSTFGARIPRHTLATALIQLADVPIAAPSANASTKPSPTAAEHVAHDLAGRINVILDGGPCAVGVESTVVDGLSSPPTVLRPGGVSLEQIRRCPGWEDTQIGYRNVAEAGSRPRAPGMKYRHYSPKAPVVLFEAGMKPPELEGLRAYVGSSRSIGVVSTASWSVCENGISVRSATDSAEESLDEDVAQDTLGFAGMLERLTVTDAGPSKLRDHHITQDGADLHLISIALGHRTSDIAKGIFSSLRELDKKDVDAILVEGIDDDGKGATAAAIMNRLRKAAEIKIQD